MISDENMMTVEETWKPVKGYEGRYEVSNLGQVRSLDRRTEYVKSTGIRSSTTLKGKLLHQRVNKTDGQVYVLICNMGRQKSTLVSRLVAEAFIGFSTQNEYVYHWDGDLTNNRVENLYLGTRNAGRSLRVKSLTTGVVYQSVGEAARQLGTSDYILTKHIRSKMPLNDEVLVFEQAADDE